MTSNHPDQLIIAGSSNQNLAKNIAKITGINLADVFLSKFANRELQVRVNQTPKSAYLLQSFSSPVNVHIMEYLLLADALKHTGTPDTISLIPWFGYSKQDRSFLKGEPVSAQVVADLIQYTNTKKLITVDLHSQRIENFFNIPVVNLKAQPILQKKVSTILRPDSIIVSPDTGAIKTALTFAQNLKRPLVKLKKHRHRTTGEVTITSTSARVKNAHCIIVDDMIATGSTLIKAAEFLRLHNAATISVVATHHLYIQGVQQKLDDLKIKNTIVTDTIQKPNSIKSNSLETVSIASLISHSLT